MLFAAPDSAEITAEETPGGDLSQMTVTDLKALAKSLGMTGYSAMNKEDLIAAIEAARRTEDE